MRRCPVRLGPENKPKCPGQKAWAQKPVSGLLEPQAREHSREKELTSPRQLAPLPQMVSRNMETKTLLGLALGSLRCLWPLFSFRRHPHQRQEA